MSPYLPWTDAFYDQNAVHRWAAAALAVPYTEEVGQSVVDVLLQIASNSSLRLHIPRDVWALLKKRVSLPPVWGGDRWEPGWKLFSTFEDSETSKFILPSRLVRVGFPFRTGCQRDGDGDQRGLQWGWGVGPPGRSHRTAGPRSCTAGPGTGIHRPG